MSESKSELLRSLGPWTSASIVVGTIIGSGIFLVPKTMAAEVGTPGMVIAVFLIGGLLSLAGALTYAELGAALPHAGGEYVYLRESYGPLWSFLYGWTHTVVAKSGSMAALAAGFVLYLGAFWPALEGALVETDLPLGPDGSAFTISLGQLVAIAVIVSLGAINYFGVKLGGRVQIALTLLKIGLILAIVGCAAMLGGGSASNLRTVTEHTGGVSGFFAALVAALWAYDGWNNVSMASGEVRDPGKNIPRALIGGVLVVMAVYAVTNLAYFYVLSADEVAATDRVASEAARRFLGAGGADAVAVVAMISIFGALNGSILSGARVPYAMARDRYFFESLSRVHPGYRTPHVSIVALCGWASILALSGRYEDLFNLVIFASWILYAMTAVSVIVLRRKRPELPRPYRVPGYPLVPIAFVVSAIALVLVTLVDSPRESLMGLGLIISGVPFYFFWKGGNVSI